MKKRFCQLTDFLVLRVMHVLRACNACIACDAHVLHVMRGICMRIVLIAFFSNDDSTDCSKV